MIKKFLPVILFTLISSTGWCPGTLMAALPVQIQLKPDHILIGASFNGTVISVTGKIPTDAEVLVRLVGHFGDTKLKTKGRALGFLWMNMGTVEFRNIPSVFLLFPSKAIEKFLNNDNNEWQKIGLGFQTLEERSVIFPTSEDKQSRFKDFRKLKESASLYGIQENKVQYGETDGTMKAFKVAMSIPSDIPQASYKVQAFAIRNGSIVASTEEHITAEEVGFPATISFLAFHHATLFGVLAVLVALIAGLLTGLIFKGSKGGH